MSNKGKRVSHDPLLHDDQRHRQIPPSTPFFRGHFFQVFSVWIMWKNEHLVRNVKWVELACFELIVLPDLSICESSLRSFRVLLGPSFLSHSRMGMPFRDRGKSFGPRLWKVTRCSVALEHVFYHDFGLIDGPSQFKILKAENWQFVADVCDGRMFDVCNQGGQTFFPCVVRLIWSVTVILKKK